MKLNDAGTFIAKARKEAGYTQAELANMLAVTDKAVSKWERDLCLPDASLLTKLSMLLDIDIEYILSRKSLNVEKSWKGVLRADNVQGEIAGKPLIHYLLSYFMLVGITDITIVSNDAEYIKKLHLEQFGLKLSFYPTISERTMVVYGKFLLFGVNITRQLQYCMSASNDISMMLHGINIPILFCHNYKVPVEIHDLHCVDKKPLGRGTMFIPLNNSVEMEDVSELVRIYEKYHSKKIADLNEIAKLRDLICADATAQ